MRVSAIIKNLLPYGISNSILKKKYIKESKHNILPSIEPPLFNEQRQKYKSIFLSSSIPNDYPYGLNGNGEIPRNIFWDKYNFGLKNHGYGHAAILNIYGKPDKLFAMFWESQAIVPNDYELFNKYKGLAESFNLILTHNSEHLNKYKNAVFIPAAGSRYGTELGGGKLDIERCKNKSKNISILSSNKSSCNMHRFRIDTAKYFKNTNIVDTFGNFDGGKRADLPDLLEKYRYSIIIENEITEYYITEKILNCFASMTIPIYIGASKISNFFNPDGIIQIFNPSLDEIKKAVKNCCEEDYNSRVTAVIDNFNRVQKDFMCIEDYIWEHYKEHFV
ncbi:MAG: glycosyltransferase family 10 [Treponema sp.]|nr:glycosyltransferase family 10 [Treponema sp.]